ncbi:MAG: lipoprotein insertase outer membrane protein LolB [Methylotetracoccus sp.]
MSRRAAYTLVAVVGLVLGGCGTAPLRTEGPAADQSALRALAHWRLDGRIAVQTPKEAIQAGLFWEHEGTQDRLRLSGPLSQGTVSIVVQPDVVLIRDSAGRTTMSRDVEQALKRELGVAVPVASLRWWVTGLPEPDVTGEARYDASGRLQRLDQRGWQIEFERFVSVGGLSLPQKMAAQGGDIKLKLVVDDWSVPR